MTFGRKLRELRKQKKWSQADLADKLKITQSMITQYENNVKLPSVDNLILISKLFDVSIDYIIGISDNKVTFDIEKEADLIKLVNSIRPKIKGAEVSDAQWEMITLFLESMVKQLELEGKIPSS